jgi:hypothetical protein
MDCSKKCAIWIPLISINRVQLNETHPYSSKKEIQNEQL